MLLFLLKSLRGLLVVEVVVEEVVGSGLGTVVSSSESVNY